MYTDFIQYKLAAGVNEAKLVEVAAVILESWMSQQEGFLSWQIHKISDTEFIDVVQWESKAAADKANENMKDIPADSPWYSCYDMSTISSKNGEEVFHS